MILQLIRKVLTADFYKLSHTISPVPGTDNYNSETPIETTRMFLKSLPHVDTGTDNKQKW